ncbi:MAG: hypothetical protein ABR577_00300 [Pyrinomonadaceae bacterium]
MMFRKLPALLIVFTLVAIIANGNTKAFASTTQTTPAPQASATLRTPTEIVLAFYEALREKRFREAFALSIYNVAINGLSDAEFAALRPEFKNLSDKEFAALRPKFQKLTTEEFEDLRPDFEKLAANVPAEISISGEQISNNEAATVFVQIKGADAKTATPEPLALFRENNSWIVGDRNDARLVRLEGKDFFFNLRIKTHQSEAQAMLRRVSLALIAYSAQHTGNFADLQTLVDAGLLPKDIQTTESTGYAFQLRLAPDARGFAVFATPARYNRTGRLSFFMDATGVKSKDTGGQLYDPRPVKK